MKYLWRILLSISLMLAITTSVLATTAFAAEDTKSKEEIPLEKLLPKALYVEKDKKAVSFL